MLSADSSRPKDHTARPPCVPSLLFANISAIKHPSEWVNTWVAMIEPISLLSRQIATVTLNVTSSSSSSSESYTRNAKGPGDDESITLQNEINYGGQFSTDEQSIIWNGVGVIRVSKFTCEFRNALGKTIVLTDRQFADTEIEIESLRFSFHQICTVSCE